MDTSTLNPKKLGLATLPTVQSLYDQGLYLQAFQAITQTQPLQDWSQTTDASIEAQVLAGRIAAHVGASRLGRLLHLRAGRQAPESPTAIYFYTYALLSFQGVFKTWKFAQTWKLPENITPRQQAEWLALQATYLGYLRDFDRAEIYLQKAENLDPENPWLYVEKAWLLEHQDRYEEALETAQYSLQLSPWHRSGTAATARLLTLLERQEEALELLTQASQKLESSAILLQLAQLQINLEDYAGAEHSYDRYEQLTPLREKAEQQYLAAWRSEIAYAQQDYPSTIIWAKQVEGKFHQNVVERLSQEPLEGTRVVLPVAFLQQHHMTCVPATLAMLSRFWGKPIDHLKLAEEICYDGTSSYNERHWVESHGWIAKEFTVTWESTIALIDRGIPFTLTTVEATSAHLQAVIGYDSYLQQILIRDPDEPSVRKVWAKAFLENYAATGPRGMALVPRDRADLFQDLDLADANLYDLAHQQRDALEKHQRQTAVQVQAKLVELAPDRYITLQACRALSAYDGDTTAILEIASQSLKLFPNNANLLQDKLSCLQVLGRREERLALLQEICDNANVHPIFWQLYAEELSDDARSTQTTIALLGKSIRFMPTTAANYTTLANVLWRQQNFEQAFELYRLATCLSDKTPRYAMAYFRAARYFEKTEEALCLLQQRWQRFGHQSSEPALTLFWAYSELDRMAEGLKLLDQACQQRPEDGDLLLASVRSYTDYGQYALAHKLLKAAKGKAAPVEWFQTAANLAQSQGNQTAAIDCWRRVIKLAPLRISAHAALAQLLAETQGLQAALAWLKQAGDRFPHSYALHQLWVNWLEDEDTIQAETVLRHMLTIDDSDAWTRRTLAKNLSDQRRFEEAITEIKIAQALEPNSPVLYGIWGRIQAMAGQMREAKQHYRKAIELSVDRDWEIRALLNLCQTQQDKEEALDFVYQELLRQVTFGDGLLAYQIAAEDILPPEQVLERLQAAWQRRSDLWQAWSALIQQMLQTDQLKSARKTSEEFTAAFPLLPKAWLDLATVQKQQKDVAGEAKSLRQALTINPNWDQALYQLSQLYAQHNKAEQAEQLLSRAIARNPREVTLYGYMADLLSDQDRKLDALNYLEKAIRIDPSYAWAWNRLREWSQELDCPDRAIAVVRQLVKERGNEARSWYFLAQALTDSEDLDEQLAAIDRAIELNPYFMDAYDLQASILTKMQRYDQAIAACTPTVWEKADRPIKLWQRQIWVEQQRDNDAVVLEQLRELLIVAPRSEWAWYQLTCQLRNLDDDVEYLAAAQKLVEFDPDDYSYWSFLGEAYQCNQQLDQAKAAYEKGLSVSHENTFSGLKLFGFHLEAGEFEQAQEILDRIQPHLDPDEHQSRLIRLKVRQGQWQDCETMLKSFDPSNEVGQTVYAAYLMALADLQAKKQIQSFIKANRQILRSHAHLWGMVSHALRETDCYRQVIKWMSDYKTREGVEAWMMSNLLESMIAVGHSETLNVLQYTIQLNSDNSSSIVSLWGAYYSARWKQSQDCVDHLISITQLNGQPRYNYMWYLTRAVLIAQTVMGSQRVRIKLIEKHLAKAKEAYPEWRSDKLFKHFYGDAYAYATSYSASWKLRWRWFRATILCR